MSTHAARGNSLHRWCVRMGWLVLNGRCRSDGSGSATHYHGSRRSVIDLSLAPRSACADMRVLPVRGGTAGHHALVTGLYLEGGESTPPSLAPDMTSRPATVRLDAS